MERELTVFELAFSDVSLVPVVEESLRVRHEEIRRDRRRNSIERAHAEFVSEVGVETQSSDEAAWCDLAATAPDELLCTLSHATLLVRTAKPTLQARVSTLLYTVKHLY